MPDSEDGVLDQDLQSCMNGLCASSKSKSRGIRGAVRNILAVVSPLLVKSPDPRIKALGLAMGVLLSTVYKK